MSRTFKGGQNPRTAIASQRDRLNYDATQLRKKNKDQLIEFAQELGVYNNIPSTGASDEPLKADIVDFLSED